MEEPQELRDRRSGVPTGRIILGIVAGAVLLYVLWRLLNYYIAPGDDPTERKDLVQAFVVLAGGLVAAGTLLIGWLNLRHNQRTLLTNQRNTQETLRNAQEVENRRAQGSSLQAYFEQMGDLLLDKGLRQAQPGDEVRILAQAQTHTVLPTLNADRKRSIVVFLYKSMLIQEPDPIVGLGGADLREVVLSNAQLSGINVQEAYLQYANLQQSFLWKANLQRAFLWEANLQGAILRETNLHQAGLQGAILQEANLIAATLQRANLWKANLKWANLQGANLSETDFWGADLTDAVLQGAQGITNEVLESQAKSLVGTTMPDGSVHD